MQQLTMSIQYKVAGETFGVRGCSSSCSCNPCDCDPCSCSSDDGRYPNYPRWRISGYAFQEGYVAHVDISQRLLISLAQPQDKNNLSGSWSEVILVDEQATEAQIQALLASFERQLHSFPAEIGPQRVWRNAVYRAPMLYRKLSSGPSLSLSFQPTEDYLVRRGASHAVPHAWEYQGPLAMREVFDLLH